MEIICPQCGAPAAAGQTYCEYCGAAITNVQPPVYTPPQPRPQGYQPQPYQSQPYGQPYGQKPVNPAISMYWPIKNKIVAGILALFLGGLGVHDFYLGRTGAGILKLVFCWTGIPAFIAFIEGIIILVSNDENFQLKYHCRLK